MGSSGGAGKDTVADIITDITGIDYQKISLAQEIHKICNKLSSNPQRNELQAVGESMRDIFGENVWMDLTDRTMHGPTIVPDIRKLLEYSHYVIERDFLPLYVYTDPEITRNRLKARDGSFNEQDLKRNIETQMNFIQELPATIVGDCSLYKVNDSGIFNNIYIIDNSRSIEETREQVEKWWELVG